MNIIILGNFDGSNFAALNNSIAIIVDVLRASTTIPLAMNRGIEDFYIAKELEDARIAGSEFNTLLMGERDCLKLPDFDFGNSPIEILKLKQFNKTKVSFTSSTGSKRVIEAIGSKVIFIGSIINAKAIASKVLDLINSINEHSPIVIIPAYSEGSIILNELTEDQIGSLLIAKEFSNEGIILSKEIESEIDFLDKLLQKQALSDLLIRTKHGQKLVNLNFKNDIAFCARQNIISTTPMSENNIIKLPNNALVVHLRKK